MKCRFCGKNISSEASYCPYCLRTQSDGQRKMVSQDTDLFVNMNRQRRMAAKRKQPKPLTQRQQLFPYVVTLAAALVLCVLLVWTSRAWGNFQMERQEMTDYGITAESMETLSQEQKEENQEGLESETESDDEDADSSEEGQA